MELTIPNMATIGNAVSMKIDFSASYKYSAIHLLPEDRFFFIHESANMKIPFLWG